MITQIIALVVGLALIVVSWMATNKECPPPRIEYRFIPRSFKEEQDSPVPVSQIFDQMFNQPTVFVQGVLGRTVTKDNVNQYFVSQS